MSKLQKNWAQMTVPKELWTGWPGEASHIMQGINELQADLLRANQHHQAAIEAADSSLEEKLSEYEEKIEEYQKEL